MGAPEYVPTKAAEAVRTYTSPPRRPESWMADRPGELGGRQPAGERLGSQGPDQGYALTLAEGFEGTLKLHRGEHEQDALAGAVAVALKRASLFGRAPVVHDLTAALTIWGFLDPNAPKELVELRHRLFEEVHHPHHYSKLREVADRVPAEVLRQPHQTIIDQARDNWKSMLALTT
ncbi:MAG TPA: hypothetical protein VJM33_08735 [Microthrixaceae bacterium]|nr:hypothetical protein [Microthrixaceae bacterium]